MTTFLTAAIIALALKMTLQFLESVMPALASNRSVVSIAAGIGTAYAISYSVFDVLKVQLRNGDVEKVVTGIALAGLITVWNTVLSYLGSKEESTSGATTHRIAA